MENPQPAQVGLPAELADGKVEAIVARTLKELGLGENRSRRILETGLHPAAEFTAWAGIILPGTNLWVDLLLEASAGDLEKLCKKSLRRAGRELEAPGVLAETHTILSAALKTRIQTRDGNAFAPLLSRVRPTQTPERPLPRILNHRSHVFAFDDCSLGLTLVASECPPRRMDPKQLQPLDILAEPVFIPGMAGVPLFTPGAVLNTRHIERLAAMALDGGDGLQVSVFQLSEIARYFYH